MNVGISVAKAWNLIPGVALSADQMAQLTTDMVWLVEKEVTLADGSTQKVLPPQLYARVQPGDLDASGGLLAALRSVLIPNTNPGQSTAALLLDRLQKAQVGALLPDYSIRIYEGISK